MIVLKILCIKGKIASSLRSSQWLFMLSVFVFAQTDNDC